MKKILVLSAILALAVSFSACRSMDYYEENLEDNGYDIDNLSNSELEEFADLFDLDPDDYKAKDSFLATHENTGVSVFVVECGSVKYAKELVEDADDIMVFLEESYSAQYSFDIINKGRFVFIGEEGAIDDALEK